MTLAKRIEGVRREAPARGLLVVPSRTVAWADLAATGDLGRLVCLANPRFRLARELGLLGWAGCPRARGELLHDRWRGEYWKVAPHKVDGRYQLTLWITDRAVCSVCGYAETLEALHARLGLGINVDGPGDGSDA